MSSEAVLAEYDQIVPLLRARGDAVARELRELLASHPSLKVHSVAWRLKGRESLVAKLARPDRSYTDLWMLTDLVGVRVITYFSDAVERVGELVEAHLPVAFEHSTDKRRRETTDFGYRSLHYVARFARIGDLLPERACFEVQVRTVLEHAWAEIEHDLGYKATEEIPLVVRRRLNRLAGLLELADQEFGAIRSDLESYARALPKQIDAGSSVPLDGFSLVALLECAEVQTLDAEIASVLSKELGDEPFFPDYLLKMLVASGIRGTEDARRGVRKHERAIAAMVAPYFALTAQLWQLSPEQMSRIPRGYSLFFLAHVEVLRTSTLRLEKIERLARLYRELDYPEDAKTAHHVASMLVDAFDHIGLEHEKKRTS
jgi:putative GTP pyrophosphokinase